MRTVARRRTKVMIASEYPAASFGSISNNPTHKDFLRIAVVTLNNCFCGFHWRSPRINIHLVDWILAAGIFPYLTFHSWGYIQHHNLLRVLTTRYQR